MIIHNVAFNAFIIPILIQLSNVYNITLMSHNFRKSQYSISSLPYCEQLVQGFLLALISRLMSLTRTTVIASVFIAMGDVCLSKKGNFKFS